MPEDAWKAHATVKNMKSSLTIAYAAEEIKDDGYGREIAFAVDMKVMPSILVEGYEVYEFNKHPSCCCLCFNVQNHSSVDMTFHVFINETKGKISTTLLATNEYFLMESNLL